ncbi:hypothetical protein [uncultured Robinsoniella sp.]
MQMAGMYFLTRSSAAPPLELYPKVC